jgi:hypothetical protein
MYARLVSQMQQQGSGLSNAFENHAAYDPEPHARNSLKMFQGSPTFGRWEKSEGRSVFVHGPIEKGDHLFLLKRWNRQSYKAE